MMAPKNETPAAVGAASRGDEVGFGNRSNHSAALPRYQLAGSVTDRVVVLDQGAIVGWATGALRPPLHVHLVGRLHLDDPELAGFRQIIGCTSEAIYCIWCDL